MIRVTPCISVVIQRKAVKNQELLDKWIAKGGFLSYDDDLICMTVAMNPYDAKQAIENLNKRLGIQIYDYSNPYEPVAKDGVIVERMFGIAAPCNWLKREKGSDGKRFGIDFLSYVPENERKPAYVPEKYDPANDTIVKDFGEYKGKCLILKENKYEMYLKHGDDRQPVPNPDPGPIAAEVLHDMDINDAILCIEDDDSFYDMIEKRIYEVSFPLLNDYGLYNGKKLEIRGGRRGVFFIQLGKEHYMLPKEIYNDKNQSAALSREQVIAYIDEEISRRNKRRTEKPLNIISDLGETTEGHIYICKGKFGNYIRLKKGEEWRNFRLPKEYKEDDELCRKLRVEDVLSTVRIEIEKE